MAQNKRTSLIENFRSGVNRILVCTDVAARGLDIDGINLVVNYDLPQEAANYVHRIGRTGRAGAKGKAFSTVSDRDVEALDRIQNFLENKVPIGWIDDAEVVKDFKPFPADRSRHSGPRTGKPGQRGGRPSDKRNSKDKPRGESRSGGRSEAPRRTKPRDDNRNEKRSDGAPRDSRSENRNEARGGSRGDNPGFLVSISSVFAAQCSLQYLVF